MILLSNTPLVSLCKIALTTLFSYNFHLAIFPKIELFGHSKGDTMSDSIKTTGVPSRDMIEAILP